jgi:hypothetical protein
MAISLSSIVTGKQTVPPRILLYGVDGIGKSTFAANAPAPIFTQTEDRLAHIDCAKFPVCKTFEDALATIKVLLTEDHEYKTHVTDSADWLEKLIHQKILKDHNEESIISNEKGSPLGFGRGYIMAEDHFRKYVSGLEALRLRKNMQIIIIAHAQIRKFDDPMRPSYDQYRPNLHERIMNMLLQWVDCAFFANFDTSVVTEKDVMKEKRKGIGGVNRIMYTQERPAFEAKNSYDLPPEMPLDYGKFVEHYKKWLAK